VGRFQESGSVAGNAVRWALRWWPWSPVFFAAVYAVALLATLGSVVAAIYSSADIASAPYIGELYAHAPHGAQVVLGNIPWYTTLWFESLTRSFPAHRVLWELAPWIFNLIGIGLVSWTASKVGDRWAAMIVAVTLACSGAGLLPILFASSVHALAYVHVCVLGAFTVLLASQSGLIGGRLWLHLATLTAVVVLTGAGIASDKLVTVGGLVPFAIASVTLALLSPGGAARRFAASGAAVTAGSIVTAEVIGAVMRHEHVVAAPFHIGFSPLNELAHHAGLLVQSLAVMMNGDLWGFGFSMTPALALLCAATLFLAAFAGARYSGVMVREIAAWHRSAGASTEQATTRAAYVSYWASSALVLSVAFVFSTVPVDVNAKRYVVTTAYAIVALAAVAAAGRTWTKAIATAGACAIVAGSAVNIVHRDIQRQLGAHPGSDVANQLRRWASSEHLVYGYAGYWDAAPLGWDTHTQVQVYPVWPLARCFGQLPKQSGHLCHSSFHQISSWYRPRVGARTFLVLDTRQLAANGIGLVEIASLGKPEQIAKFQQLTVYVYPYDIAARFSAS
jgi:hypothetical protein